MSIMSAADLANTQKLNLSGNTGGATIMPVTLPVDSDTISTVLTAAAQTEADAAQVAEDRAAVEANGDLVAARNPDSIIAGAITRDANGTAISAPVVWPNGTPGTYTADVVSTDFPGAVDAYHITYGSPVTKTYTQPTVTRNSDGAVVNAPEIVVS